MYAQGSYVFSLAAARGKAVPHERRARRELFRYALEDASGVAHYATGLDAFAALAAEIEARFPGHPEPWVGLRRAKITETE